MAKKKAAEPPKPEPVAEAKGQVSIITLKGSDAYRDWLAAESKRTHIPAASIVRLGLALWASQNGGRTPPEK
jgi:hypothetical protein